MASPFYFGETAYVGVVQKEDGKGNETEKGKDLFLPPFPISLFAHLLSSFPPPQTKTTSGLMYVFLSFLSREAPSSSSSSSSVISIPRPSPPLTIAPVPPPPLSPYLLVYVSGLLPPPPPLPPPRKFILPPPSTQRLSGAVGGKAFTRDLG